MLSIILSIFCLIQGPSLEIDFSKLSGEASKAIIDQQSKLNNVASDWHLLGMLYQANGLNNQAILAYKHANSLEATEKTKYLLGIALANEGNYQEAINSVSPIENYIPAIWRKGYWNLDLGNFELAEESFKEAIKLQANCVAAIVGLARTKLTNNSPKDAISILEDIISRGGDHPYITFLLGTAHRRAGNHETASELLSAPISGPPRWEDPWFENMLAKKKGYAADLARAVLKYDEGNLSGALQDLKKLSINYPKDPAVLNNLATIYLHLGQIEESTDTLKKSMRWSPTYAPTQLTMAYVMQKTGQIDLAIAYAKKAIQYQPAMSLAHALVGRLYLQKGDFKSAIKYLSSSIELGNSNLENREMLGIAFLNTGKPQEALNQFNLVLQTSSNRTNSIGGKCISIALLGDPNKALTILGSAKQTYPNDKFIERAWQSVLRIKGRQ